MQRGRDNDAAQLVVTAILVADSPCRVFIAGDGDAIQLVAFLERETEKLMSVMF